MKRPGQDFVVPDDIRPEDMPDLLRHWYLGPPSRRYMSRRRFHEVDAALQIGSGSRVLDVGAAWGYHTMSLARRGARSVGVDLVIEYVDVSRSIATANGVPLDLVGADAAQLPFADAIFDAVSMVETVEHVYREDRRAVLSECYRVLRPGGRLALSTPNYAGLVERTKRVAARIAWLRPKLPVMCLPTDPVTRDDYHPRRYHDPVPTRHLVSLVEEAGFEVRRATPFLFILKETPPVLMPVARGLEWLAERTPLIRHLAATICVVADRPVR